MRIGFIIAGLIFGRYLMMGQYSERMTRPQYFEKYKEIAIQEMHRSKIPASITLAQGALESGDGNSRLARNGNNHFGIKCHKNWSGRKIFEDDDAKNECFRKYSSVEDSYRDHSEYLTTSTRYASLFDLKITDYKGWARGLKKAGYATSPTYAESLIKIIENYNLSIYDEMDEGKVQTPEKAGFPKSTSTRPVMERNRVKYILARPGDTFESITDDLGKLSWEIPQYNDINQIDTLVPGQIIFIQPKRNKAEAGKDTHSVKEGETMYTISQLYAIKLERLYLMNNMNSGTRPAPGTVLQLRKAVRKTLQKPVHNDSMQEEEGEEIKIDLNLE